MPRRLAPVLLLAAAAASYAAQPQFWRLESARDFLQGETENLVIESDGRVRLAPSLLVLHDPQTPYVWSLACDGQGVVYAGTGNNGKVFRIEKDTVTEWLDTSELEVHALAVGPDGRLYVGTSPDGKVYRVDQDRKAETFFDPPDKYIWAMAFDPRGNLYVATGLDGRVHRIDPSGKAEVILSTSEAHILALTSDRNGNIYAGSSPGAIIYRVDPAGGVFVLQDTSFREVKALDPGPDGSLYAAVVDGREKVEPAARPTTTAPLPSVIEFPAPEAVPPPQPTPTPAASPLPPPPDLTRAGAIKGAVLRILATGETETLWSSAEDVPHALVATDDGVVVGTGNKGKLYRIRSQRVWTMLVDLPAEQVTALERDRHGAVVIGVSNPGKVHRIEATLAEQGGFLSKPYDTETVSTWGRLAWEAEVPAGTRIEIKTRSGNTSIPDSTWSEWSNALTRPEPSVVTSPRARFLQVKATLLGTGKVSPILSSVSAAFLQRNLHPQVQSITVHPPGEVFQKPLAIGGELEVLGLDPADGVDLRPGQASRPVTGASSAVFSRRMFERGIQTFTWKADDPNSDALSYQVEYRLLGEKTFRVLKRNLSEAVLAWDTTTVPNGRYVVKVIASDALSNPASLALTSEKESDPFDIDNTPPTVTVTIAGRAPARVRAVVRDDMTPIKRADFAVDGGRWQEIYPLDGIADTQEEIYEIPLPELSPGSHVVVVRAVDRLSNVATAQVELP